MRYRVTIVDAKGETIQMVEGPNPKQVLAFFKGRDPNTQLAYQGGTAMLVMTVTDPKEIMMTLEDASNYYQPPIKG